MDRASSDAAAGSVGPPGQPQGARRDTCDHPSSPRGTIRNMRRCFKCRRSETKQGMYRANHHGARPLVLVFQLFCVQALWESLQRALVLVWCRWEHACTSSSSQHSLPRSCSSFSRFQLSSIGGPEGGGGHAICQIRIGFNL